MMYSIWEELSFRNAPDLVVVGAGITGLFTALHAKLKDPHRRVLVLEKGPYPSGASVKNAGFACFGSPSQLLFDLDHEGEEVMLGRVVERWEGLQELRATLGDQAIGYEPVGGYEVFRGGDPLHGKVSERLCDLNRRLKPIFNQDIFRWTDERIRFLGLDAGHLVWNALEGALDSGRLMHTLLQKAQGAGVEVCFGRAVERWEELLDGVELKLAGGDVLKASQTVIATNGYTRTLVPDTDIVPGRGQVVLTSVIPGLQLEGTFHMDEGFYYFRHFQGRVLLGGGRHLDMAGEATMEEGSTPLIQQALETLLRETILPGRGFRIERRWSGIMGFRSQGGPPVVKRLSPHVVLAAGLGGIGVAVGIRVARKAMELVV